MKVWIVTSTGAPAVYADVELAKREATAHGCAVMTGPHEVNGLCSEAPRPRDLCDGCRAVQPGPHSPGCEATSTTPERLCIAEAQATSQTILNTLKDGDG